MTATTVFDAPDVTVALMGTSGRIVVTWGHFGDHAVFRAALDAQAELVETGLATTIVIDVSAATGTPSARDHDYVNRFIFPRYREGGLRAMVTVTARSSHTRLGTRNWTHSAKAWRFAIHEVDDLAQAHALLDSLGA